MTSDRPRVTFAQQVRFCIKELRETLRDRRTIVTLLMMPLLTYPLLGLGLRFISTKAARDQEGASYQFLLATDREGEWFNDVLRAGERLLATDEPPADIAIFVPDDGATLDLSASVSAGEADLGLKITWSDDFSFGPQQAATVEFVQMKDSPTSRAAADFVRTRLDAVNAVVVTTWAKSQSEDFELPITQTKSEVTAPPAPSAIIGLLPLVLLLMTVTGGVYPAIDLTAGERERDTLETLMALPVPPFRLLLAKYAACLLYTSPSPRD